MKKYYVTVSLEVEADSARQAAIETYGQLSDHRQSDAQVRVYNPPEVDKGKSMQITSSRWTYSANPQEVLPPKPPAPAAPLGFAPAKAPEVPLMALETTVPEDDDFDIPPAPPAPMSLTGAVREVFGS